MIEEKISVSNFKKLHPEKQVSTGILNQMDIMDLLFILIDTTVETSVSKTVGIYIIQNRMIEDSIGDDNALDNFRLEADDEKLKMINSLNTRDLISLTTDDNVSYNLIPAIYEELVKRFDKIKFINIDKDDDKDPRLKKFNWGAFLSSIVWTFFNKRWGYSILYVFLIYVFIIEDKRNTFFIFLFSLLPYFLVSLRLGHKANKLVWESKKDDYQSIDNLIIEQKKWIYIGIPIGLIFYILFILFTIGFIKFILFASFGI